MSKSMIHDRLSFILKRDKGSRALNHRSYLKDHISSSGYTLIELTVVMGLLIVVGVVIIGILSSTLTGSSKSRTTNDLAQNGNYALSEMSNLLINSQQLISFTPSGQPAISDCSTSPPSGKTLTVLGFDGGTTTLTCDDVNNTISSTSAVFLPLVPTPLVPPVTNLIDTTRVRLVPGTCSFTCAQQDSYSPPRIDIQFQLQSANSSTAKAIFNTTVSLRNQGQ